MGSPSHIHIYARLFGEQGEISDITSELGLEPTKVVKKDNFICWERSLEGANCHPDELLWELAKDFDPVRVKSIKDRFNLDMGFTIVMTTTYPKPSICLPPSILSFLSELDAILDIDFCHRIS